MGNVSVLLARTLLENRPVILLDEPFSALDARTRVTCRPCRCQLIGRTVLLVTHDPNDSEALQSYLPTSK